jgi:hypothetical protein
VTWSGIIDQEDGSGSIGPARLPASKLGHSDGEGQEEAMKPSVGDTTNIVTPQRGFPTRYRGQVLNFVGGTLVTRCTHYICRYLTK